MEDSLTEEPSDWIAPVRDPQDLRETSEEEAKKVSEEAEEHPETQEVYWLT